MDNLSSNNVETALIQYRLLSCNAEAKIKARPDSGGSIEITSEIKTPSSPAILKKDDPFVIRIFIGIIGKSKDSEDIAFSASCSFEGDYRLVKCEKNGVPIESNFKLWSLAINQLHPLVAQFATDLASRMGFINVIVPPILLGQYAPKSSPKKTLPKKVKKTIPAKVR